jgi:hypothetical protein
MAGGTRATSFRCPLQQTETLNRCGASANDDGPAKETRARRSRVDVRGSRRHLDAPRRATHAREGCRLYSDLGRVGRRRRNPRVVISYRLSVFVRTQNTGTGSRSHDLPGTTFGGHLINWGSGRDKGMGSFCRCALPATTTLHPSRRRRSRPSTTH